MKKLKQLLLAFAVLVFAVIGHSQTINTGSRIAVNQPIQVAQKELTVGFNLGQLYTTIATNYGKTDKLPDDFLAFVKANVAPNLLGTIRFSGTMSNYMNIHQKGFGEHIEQYQQFQRLLGQIPISEKKKFDDALNKTILSKVPFFGRFVKNANSDDVNMRNLISITDKVVDKSFVYNFVESCKQLGVKNVEFTFNSHMPYRGLHTLEQSLNTLRYVKNNTNLTHIELENESYFSDYICGKNNNENITYNTVKPFYSYLENTVVPAIAKEMGKDFPLGLSVINNFASKFKGYNRAVKETADRLKAKGYNIYLVPHLYFADASESTIEKEIESVISVYGTEYEYRITEFNVTPEFYKNMSQKDIYEFVDRVIKVCKRKGISAIFYHTLYEGNFPKAGSYPYSYIKN